MSITQLQSFLAALDINQQDQLEAELAKYQAEKIADRIEAAKASGDAANSQLKNVYAKAEYIVELGKQIQKSFNKAFSTNKKAREAIGDVAYDYLKSGLAYSNKQATALANMLAQITLEQCANAVFSTVELTIFEDWWSYMTPAQLAEYNKERATEKKPPLQPAKTVEASKDATLTNIVVSIGREVELALKFNTLKETNKEAFYPIYRKTLADPLFGKEFAIKMANKAVDEVEGFEWQAFSKSQVFYLGFMLIDALLSDSIYRQSSKKALYSVVNIDAKEDGQFVSYKLIVPSDVLEKKADSVQQMAMANAMLKLPMTVVPNDWSYEVYGGYLANEFLKRDKLVRRKDSEANIATEVPQCAIDTLNKLQRTGYVVNDFVLSVIEPLREKLAATADPKRQPKIGKFMPAIVGMKKWQSRKTFRTETVVAVAKKFSGSVFYCPYSFDYRGRMYPIASVLNPQGTDFEKAIIKFAKAKPLTESGVQWLKIFIANSYGKDKVSFAERIAFVDDSVDLITAVATDPVGNLDKWQDVSEPWLFLAACEEYYACCIAKTRSESNLPVAVDATCSGIQVLAGITKDAKAAKLVNVTYSDAPQDAYRAVAEYAVKLLKANKQVSASALKLITRSVVKKVVMTVPYNATPGTNTVQIRQAIADAEPKKMPSKDEIKLISAAIREAMSVVLPGPLNFRDRLNKAVTAKAKDLNGKCLEWHSPSGFLVRQLKNVADTKVVAYQLGGLRSEATLVVGYTNEPYARGHSSACSPNMIHSCDAAILHKSFCEWQAPIALIHDSAIALASDIDDVQKLLKSTYADLFSGDAAVNMLNEIVPGILDNVAEYVTETFDPKQVEESLYFFS